MPPAHARSGGRHRSVRMRARGRHRPSAVRWIFSREASAGASQAFAALTTSATGRSGSAARDRTGSSPCRTLLNNCGRRSFPCGGGVSGGPDCCRVHRDVPVDPARRILGCLKFRQPHLPRSVRGPWAMAHVDHRPWPEPFRKVTPLHTRSRPAKDTVDHPAATLQRPRRAPPGGRNNASRSHSAFVRSPRPIPPAWLQLHTHVRRSENQCRGLPPSGGHADTGS